MVLNLITSNNFDKAILIKGLIPEFILKRLRINLKNLYYKEWHHYGCNFIDPVKIKFYAIKNLYLHHYHPKLGKMVKLKTNEWINKKYRDPESVRNYYLQGK